MGLRGIDWNSVAGLVSVSFSRFHTKYFLSVLQSWKICILKRNILPKLGKSDSLPEPAPNSGNNRRKLVAWRRHRLHLNLVGVEWVGAGRSLECDTFNRQKFRWPPCFRTWFLVVIKFFSWSLVAQRGWSPASLWSYCDDKPRRRHCHQKSCF